MMEVFRFHYGFGYAALVAIVMMRDFQGKGDTTYANCSCPGQKCALMVDKAEHRGRLGEKQDAHCSRCIN